MSLTEKERAERAEAEAFGEYVDYNTPEDQADADKHNSAIADAIASGDVAAILSAIGGCEARFPGDPFVQIWLLQLRLKYDPDARAKQAARMASHTQEIQA